LLQPFSYACPKDVEEALVLLSNAGARPIAGGTDLVIQLRAKKLPVNPLLVDLAHLAELHFLAECENQLKLGALLTHQELADSPQIQREAPLLSQACRQIGTPQIRERGTLGGNIVHASPAADTVPPLLVHDALLTLRSTCGNRSLAANSFFLAPYQTEIRHTELLIQVCLQKLSGYGFGYQRLIRRQAVGIARLSVAGALLLEGSQVREARIACGAAAPMAFRAYKTESWLAGKQCSAETFLEAGERVSAEMIERSGVRWSTPYKQPVLATLVERALDQAAAIANG
jgi:CO/xanthine dehydrogenase FAD-binding subunit